MVWRPAPKRKYQARDAAITSKMMSSIRWRDSAAELALRKALSARQIRYRLHPKNVEGKPDFVFPSLKVAVFVDGDYWHGRAIIEDGVGAFRRTMRTKRREWWVTKLQRNIARDSLVNNHLRAAGWKVIRFWESDVLKDADKYAQRVARVLLQRSRLRTAN